MVSGRKWNSHLTTGGQDKPKPAFFLELENSQISVGKDRVEERRGEETTKSRTSKKDTIAELGVWVNTYLGRYGTAPPSLSRQTKCQ